MAANRRQPVFKRSSPAGAIGSALTIVLLTAAVVVGTGISCPNGCVCSGGANGSHVSCEGADLVAIPSTADLPSKIASIDVSRNSRLGPRLGRVSIDHLRRLVTMTALVELKIRECYLETIEGVFDGDSSSVSVSPKNDDVGGRKISSSSMSSSSLKELDLSGNRVVRLATGSFRQVSSHLTHLDLSENWLAEIEPGAFGGLRSLVRLELRQNRLTQIEASTFAGLGLGLRHLRLDENRIAVLDRESFAGLERLTYLVLRGNPLGTTAASSPHPDQNRTRHHHHPHQQQQQQQQQQHKVLTLQFQSPVLSYIDLSECDLDHMPRGLPHRSLRYLQLRRNRISSVSRVDVDDCCSNVAVLVLDENRLDSLVDSPFADRPHLRQLWLAGNRLAAIPQPLPFGLERLFLDGNVIDRIEADDFPIGSRLQTLSLGSNRLGPALAVDAISRLGELRSLDLSANELRSIRSKTFAGNRLLESLSLAKNPFDGGEFEEGAFDGLGRLETLVMSHVLPPVTSSDTQSPTMTSFYPGTFRGFRGGRLRKLDLDGSRGFIRDLLSANVSVLEPLGDIDELSMLDADLETVRPDFTDIFHSLAVYRVSGSRWRCDRSLMWFRDFLRTVSASSAPMHAGRQHRHPDESSTTALSSDIGNRCGSPPSVRDRSLTSLADSDFEPQEEAFLQRPSLTVPLVNDFSRFHWPTSTESTIGRHSIPKQLNISVTKTRADDHAGSRASPVEVGDERQEVEIGQFLLQAADGKKPSQYGRSMTSTEVEDSTTTTSSTTVSSTSTSKSPVSVTASTGAAYNSSNAASRSQFPAFSADSQVSSRSKKSQDEEDEAATEAAIRSSTSTFSTSAAALIVTPIVVGTVIVASVILTMIAVLCRRRHKLENASYHQGSDCGRSPKKNLAGGDSGRHLRLCVRTSFVGSTPTTTSTTVTTEAVVLASTTLGAGGVDRSMDSGYVSVGSRELIGLIPGRDINHEGPLRVYKWEDF